MASSSPNGKLKSRFKHLAFATRFISTVEMQKKPKDKMDKEKGASQKETSNQKNQIQSLVQKQTPMLAIMLAKKKTQNRAQKQIQHLKGKIQNKKGNGISGKQPA